MAELFANQFVTALTAPITSTASVGTTFAGGYSQTVTSMGTYGAARTPSGGYATSSTYMGD